MTRSLGAGQSHTIFSWLRIPPALETTMPLVRNPEVRRLSAGSCPSSTSRASPAVTGWSFAAAAPATRCTRPARVRTESTGRSAR